MNSLETGPPVEIRIEAQDRPNPMAFHHCDVHRNLKRDRPIVDMTGLTGNYDFTIRLTPEDYQAMLIRAALNTGMTIPPEVLRNLSQYTSGEGLRDALQQVGLKLESRKAPLDVIEIDDALRTPTPN